MRSRIGAREGARSARSIAPPPFVLACALTALLAGCVERGDFGRPKPSVWNDVAATAGTLSATARGDAVSLFPLTDDEAELRGRAWRFLAPAHERAWFDRVLAELAATRIGPADVAADDPTVYHRALLSEWARSPTSLYRRLSEDASADTHLLPPIALVAARVLTADRVRLRALDWARDLSPGDIAHATARVAENRCLVAWIRFGLDRRFFRYRYALEHLVIETPQGDAVPAERALTRLAQGRAEIDRLGIPPLASGSCPAPEDAIVVAPLPPQGSPLPLVRKG